jgi:hypothetical protein
MWPMRAIEIISFSLLMDMLLHQKVESSHVLHGTLSQPRMLSMGLHMMSSMEPSVFGMESTHLWHTVMTTCQHMRKISSAVSTKWTQVRVTLHGGIKQPIFPGGQNL